MRVKEVCYPNFNKYNAQLRKFVVEPINALMSNSLSVLVLQFPLMCDA